MRACPSCDKLARRANRFRYSEIVSSPKLKNISLYQNKKSGYITSIPARQEGRIMIVTAWDGERWTPKLRQTSAADAYGEDVWS